MAAIVKIITGAVEACALSSTHVAGVVWEREHIARFACSTAYGEMPPTCSASMHNY